MPGTARWVAGTALAALGLAGGGVAGTRAAPAAAPDSVGAAAWTTYHADNGRSGVDPSGATLTPPHRVWVSGTLDGGVYASPPCLGRHGPRRHGE